MKTAKGKQNSSINPAILTHLAAAQSLVDKGPKNARRHVRKAKNVAMRKQTRLPATIRSTFCKKCETPLIAGKNCRVRIRAGYAIFRCAACGCMQKFGGKRKTA